jgi:hypothetical protein
MDLRSGDSPACEKRSQHRPMIRQLSQEYEGRRLESGRNLIEGARQGVSVTHTDSNPPEESERRFSSGVPHAIFIVAALDGCVRRFLCVLSLVVSCRRAWVSTRRPELDEMRKALLDSPVATTALIVSAAALIVSVRSCAIGEEAQVQARAQYQQERQLVLTGNFKTPKETDCTQEMTIAPISPDFKFQTGTAFFPPKVFDQPVPIGNDGRFGLMG